MTTENKAVHSDMSLESLVEWAAGWVPDYSRENFAKTLRAELLHRFSEGTQREEDLRRARLALQEVAGQRDDALRRLAEEQKRIREAVAIFKGFRAGCSICDDEGHELDWRDIDRRCKAAIDMLETPK